MKKETGLDDSESDRAQRIIRTLLVAAVIGMAGLGLSKESVRDAISRFNPHCIEDIDPDFQITCSILNPESPAKPPKPIFPRTIHEYYATSEALGTPHRVPLIPNSTPTPR